MNETKRVTEQKAKLTSGEWVQRIKDCQSSGMSAAAWCRENGISENSYYHHRKKILESAGEENSIVPIEKPNRMPSDIRIESGELTVTLSESVTPDMVRTILSVLKSC